MAEGIEEVLRFAIKRAQEAEELYKAWARTVAGEGFRVVLGDLGASEHDHAQVLAHVTPADFRSGAQHAARDLDLPSEPVAIEAQALSALPFVDGLAAAVRREGGMAQLYDHLATCGGEVAPLFRTLANDERAHRAKLETIRNSICDRGEGVGTQDGSRG